MDYHELEKTTVGNLREMLKEKDPEVKGVSGMKKAELVEALAPLMGIEKDKPAAKATKTKSKGKGAPAVPRDKTVIKAEIKKLKAEKEEAIANRDKSKTKTLRRQLHKLRRELKRAALISVAA